ncbi:hypothetical protein GCM10009718_22230 [Isoptericola halotolerans]
MVTMATIGTQSDLEAEQDGVKPTPHVPQDTWIQQHGPAVGLLVGLSAVLWTLLQYAG